MIIKNDSNCSDDMTVEEFGKYLDKIVSDRPFRVENSDNVDIYEVLRDLDKERD